MGMFGRYKSYERKTEVIREILSNCLNFSSKKYCVFFF